MPSIGCYFNNESNYSLDDMEKDSSLIARITVTNSREMSLRSTKTMVKIELMQDSDRFCRNK